MGQNVSSSFNSGDNFVFCVKAHIDSMLPDWGEQGQIFRIYDWNTEREGKAKDPFLMKARQGVGGKQSSVCSKRKATSFRGIWKKPAHTQSSANQAVKSQNLSKEQNMILY